ncbi:hypothetical protein ACFXAW_02915 [Streptomyces sp. NPDC059445]|uniref:hypothetical protein n=1 Tax=Streptomyces sp. NPDC059445 TaxID=3346832 RepID=UPI0036B0CB30
MKMTRHTGLYAALALLIGCTTGGGGYAGFCVGGVWGATAGAFVAACTLLLSVRISILLCDLSMHEIMSSLQDDDVHVELTAEAMLRAVTLYEAAVFPLTSSGVSPEERQARRTTAYLMAADDRLPRATQVAAAEALEAIDLGRDRKRVSADVLVLRHTVRECRVSHARLRRDQHS